ncbi:MAG: hypothetical protein ACLRSW_06785 [Christensenellaceae bacterium]
MMRAIETENRYIRILSLDEGLKALNLVLENLSKIDHVNGKAYIERNKPQGKRKNTNFSIKPYTYNDRRYS